MMTATFYRAESKVNRGTAPPAGAFREYWQALVPVKLHISFEECLRATRLGHLESTWNTESTKISAEDGNGADNVQRYLISTKAREVRMG